MKFLKSNWSNILLLLIVALLIIPQTRKPIQVQVSRLLSFGPSEIPETERNVLLDYNWRLRDLSGNVTNLKIAQGEVAVINLWATWCPPCIAEMPSFQAIFDSYGDKINFYFVSSEDEEKLYTFLENKSYDFPVYQPVSDAPAMLNSNSLPTTYVISKTGEIVVQKSGAADWNSESFQELLEELLAQDL